jgi:hypothetical protein
MLPAKVITRALLLMSKVVYRHRRLNLVRPKVWAATMTAAEYTTLGILIAALVMCAGFAFLKRDF